MALSHTEQEMLDSKEICANFNFDITKQLAKEIGTKRIIFSGMGSSLIFPGKQAKHRALSYNLQNRVEVYFSSDLLQYTDFTDTYLFLCSNSGNTKEVMLLLEHARERGATCIGVTAVTDSPLAKQCNEVVLLSGGLERGVAATKSVIEQALICDSLIFHLAKEQGHQIDFSALQKNLKDAGDKMLSNINLVIEEQLLESLAHSPQYFFVGLDTGAAEEIALKAQETVRKLSMFYPDTEILHGPAEAIQHGYLIFFEPSYFKNYLKNFQVFAQTTSTKILEIGPNIFTSGLHISINETFKNYCLLAGGWGLLKNIVKFLNIDMDHPQKITKVGMPYTK